MPTTIRVWRRFTFALLLIAACIRGESIAYADAAARWTDAQLAGFSDVVLRGRVTRVASGRDSSAVYTYVSIDVTEVLKGRIADRRVTLKQLGGRVGSTELHIAGQPEFAAGEDVVVFLEMRPRDRTLATTAAWQGKFTVIGGAAGETALRRDPGGESRGSFGDRSRAVVSWLPLLRSLIGSSPSNAARQDAINVTPVESQTAAAIVAGSVAAAWPDPQRLRVDAVRSAQPGAADEAERQLRAAADYWSATGIATFDTGGLQGPGCFTAREPDGRVAVGADGCGELSPRGGTIALSGQWIDHGRAGDQLAVPRVIGAGVITNPGATAKRLLSRPACFDQIVTHELGHTLGLADSSDGSGVMAPFVDCESGFGAVPASGERRAAKRPTFVPLDSHGAQSVTCVVGCNVSLAAGISVPDAPTNLSYTLNGSTLTLTWTAPAAGFPAFTYVIQAGSTPGGTDVANFATDSLATSFTATVGGNAVFYIRILGRAQGGNGPASNEIVVVVGTATAAPGPPGGLTATAAGSNVTLTWNPPSTGGAVTTYVIEAGSQPGGSNLANFGTGSTATSFVASGVGAGAYFVRVRASNAGGVSGPSNEVLLLVGGGCQAPGPPGNLSSSISGSTVSLVWTAGAEATSYRVQAGSSPGQSDLADFDIGSAGTTLLVANVGAGTYFVRLLSSNACGTSAASNEVVIIVR